MSDQDLAYIRDYYQVPATLRGRVEFDGKPAVIIGAEGAYLRIRVAGASDPLLVHPTWRMEYSAELRGED